MDKTKKTDKMSNTIVLGVFILVGFALGAVILSSAGSGKSRKPDLTSVNRKIEVLTGKVDSLERRVARLNERLEQSIAAIQPGSGTAREPQGRPAPTGRDSRGTSSRGYPDRRDNRTARVQPPRPQPAPEPRPPIEEVREDSEAANREKRAEEAKKWREQQTAQLRKKLDEQLAGLAQKLGLDAAQEMLVRSVGEDVMSRITAHWDNWEVRLADATDEEWGEFKGEFPRIYEEAARQLEGQVTEEQRGAIMGFIKESGK
jgi:hypothetical protein